MKMKAKSNLTLMINCDAGGDMHDRTSHVCGCGSVPVERRSQKQKCVAISSTESEYVAAGEGIKLLLMVRNLCEDTRLPPTSVFMATRLDPSAGHQSTRQAH